MNVSCGHEALSDDWLLPGTGISLTVCGLRGMEGFGVESVAGFRWNVQDGLDEKLFRVFPSSGWGQNKANIQRGITGLIGLHAYQHWVKGNSVQPLLLRLRYLQSATLDRPVLLA